MFYPGSPRGKQWILDVVCHSHARSGHVAHSHVLMTRQTLYVFTCCNVFFFFFSVFLYFCKEYDVSKKSCVGVSDMKAKTCQTWRRKHEMTQNVL